MSPQQVGCNDGPPHTPDLAVVAHPSTEARAAQGSAHRRPPAVASDLLRALATGDMVGHAPQDHVPVTAPGRRTTTVSHTFHQVGKGPVRLPEVTRGLRITRNRVGGSIVVHASGVVDLNTAGQLASALRAGYTSAAR